MSSKLRSISKEELIKNNGEEGRPLWVLIHGKVYDVTNFKHPGGREAMENDLYPTGYEDKGEDFDEAHDEKVIETREKFLIGELKQEKPVAQPTAQAVGNKQSASNSGIFLLLLSTFVAVAAGFLYYRT